MLFPVSHLFHQFWSAKTIGFSFPQWEIIAYRLREGILKVGQALRLRYRDYVCHPEVRRI
jgi:hypothetical protein